MPVNLLAGVVTDYVRCLCPQKSGCYTKNKSIYMITLLVNRKKECGPMRQFLVKVLDDGDRESSRF